MRKSPFLQQRGQELADGLGQSIELFPFVSPFVEAYPVGIDRKRACATRINVSAFIKKSAFFVSLKHC